MRYKNVLPAMLLTALLPMAAIAAEDEKVWNNVLKPEYFAQQAIEESNGVIELEAPMRAEDPALVPFKIVSKIKQTKDNYIKRILVLVDNNPFPFVGDFDFTPESGKADVAMRIRVNSNSNIRAIAEMNDGKLIMTKKFVKASGGCSAPIGANLDEAMSRLGKMKFRLEDEVKIGEPNQVQLMISHPNITGMQMDQITRFVKKSHFVKDVKVTFNGKPVFIAKTDIAISSDPNFRFYFVPDKAGELKAEVTDTSCELPTKRDVCSKGNTFTETFKVQP
jgi:sulfur-oxidizing protein SoxY